MSIENLNFKLILNDKDFNEAIDKAKQKALEMNTSVSSLLNMSKQMVASAKEIRDAYKDMTTGLKGAAKDMQSISKGMSDAAEGSKEYVKQIRKLELALYRAQQKQRDLRNDVDATKAAMKRLADESARVQTPNADNIGSTNKEIEKQKTLVGELGTLAKQYLSVKAIAGFTKRLVTITGEFEKQQVALRTILNDAAGADKIFAKIKELSVESPFTLLDLSSYTKQLAAFSVPMDDLYNTTKMLADISAGLGVSMDRIVLAYGQVRAASFLRGQEVRQFTEAGIPILEELQKQFSELEHRAVTVNEVFTKISKRQVPFEMVNQALVNMTSEGGKFFKMQEVLANTLSGKMEKLKDQFQIVLSEIGNANSGILHGTADKILVLLKHYQALGRIITGLATSYTLFKVLIAAANSVQSINKAITDAQNTSLAMQNVQLSRSSAAWMVFKGKLLSTKGIIGMVSIALGVVVGALMKMKAAQQEVEIDTREATRRYDEQASTLERLKKALSDANTSERDRKNAINEFNREFGDYLDGMITETTSAENLAIAYGKVTEALKKTFNERIRTSLVSEPQSKYNDYMSQLTVQLVALAQKRDNAPELLNKISEWLTDDELSQKDLYDNILKEFKLKDVPASATNYAGLNVSTKIKELIDGLYQYRDALKVAEGQYDSFIEQQTNKNGGGNVLQFDDTLNLKGVIAEIKEYDKNIEKLRKINREGTPNDAEGITKMVKNIMGVDWYEEHGGDKTKFTMAQMDKFLDDEIKARQALKDRYKKLTDNDYDDFNGGRNQSREARQREQIKMLEDRAEAIKRVQDAYERLRDAGVPSGYIQDTLSVLGMDPTVLDEGYEEQILAIADAIEKIGTAEAKTSAQKLRDSIARDSVKDYTDALRAFDAWRKAVDDWAAHDYELEGEAIAAKISRIITNMNTSNNKVDLDTDRMLKDLEKAQRNPQLQRAVVDTYGQAVYDAYVTGGEKAIRDLATKNKEYNQKVAQQSINDLAQTYVNDILSQFDLTDFGDKTLSQIDDILAGLNGKLGDTSDISQDIVDKLKEAGIDLEKFKALVEELLKKRIGDVTDEWWKKWKSNVNEVTKSMETLGGTITNLGDALGKDWLSGIGQGLSSLSSAGNSILGSFSMKEGTKLDFSSLSNLKESMKNIKVDAFSALSGAISHTSNVIAIYTNQLKENEQAQKAWEDACLEAMQNARLSRIEQYEFQESNIFGVSNPYAKALAGIDQYNAAFSELSKMTNQLASGKVQTGLKKTFSLGNTASGAANGLAAGVLGYVGVATMIGASLGPIGAAIGAAAGLITGAIVGAVSAAKVPVYNTLIDEYGWLYDPDTYELNEKIRNDISKMDDETKQLIEDWDEIRDKMKEADEQLEQALSDLVGSLGDDLSNILAEAFKNDKIDASIDDLRSKVTDLLYDLVHQTAYALAFQDLFDELTDRMKKSMDKMHGGDGDIADDLMWFDEHLPEALEMYKYAAEGMAESLMKAGYELQDANADAGESLSAGIKSITENTASLLASYVNAIRSDVSSMRSIQSSNLQLENDFFTNQAPNINDYLMHIQANTYDNNVQTREILTELRSVIAPYDGGGRGINVNT